MKSDLETGHHSYGLLVPSGDEGGEDEEGQNRSV